MTDYEKIKKYAPHFMYELSEANDKTKFKLNLTTLDIWNLFQYYRQIVGSPDKHIKTLRDMKII